MSIEEKQIGGPHILVFPYPAQGHMPTLLDLTHQLAIRGLTVTIVVTPKNLPSLTPLLSAHPNTVRPLILPFPPHPAIPAGVENLRQLGNRGNIPTINALKALSDPIARWFRSHPNPPSAIIFDLFLGWVVADLCADLRVRPVSFSCTSAFLAAVFSDGWLRLRREPGSSSLRFPRLPGSPEFRSDELPSLMRLCREPNAETDFVTASVLAGVDYHSGETVGVFNTYESLEAKYLSHLRGAGPDLRRRVFAVGPLGVPAENPDSALEPGLARWLASCEDGSVLYVCFGSQKVLEERQAGALALGLERSGARFIWAANPGLVVPDGFEERVENRGVILRGWAPQREILGHPAVGAFLSHCGWNSVLEAVVAGVAVLAWPMEADQHVNARLLADDLGVATRVCSGSDAVPDPSALAGAVARVMKLGRNDPRVAEMRDRARAALREAGRELDELARVLRELPKPVVSECSKGVNGLAI